MTEPHVADDVVVGAGAEVGPGAVLEAGVRVGDRTTIGPNAIVLAGTSIGADCVVEAGAVLGKRPRLRSQSRAPRGELPGLVVGGGGTICAGGCLARFLHFPSLPSVSATMVSCPRAASAACRLEPMKPAPPVIKIISALYNKADEATGSCKAGDIMSERSASGSGRSLLRRKPLADIAALEIPTGQPIVYQLTDDLTATDRYYLSER